MEWWRESITFGLALLGAVLGVINTWRAINRDKLKLRVRAVWAYSTNVPNAPEKMIGIEVINRSEFAVTIIEVGMMIACSSDRAAIIAPILADNGPWPRRLEPREQITAYGDANSFDPKLDHTFPFARTACGETQLGKRA